MSLWVWVDRRLDDFSSFLLWFPLLGPPGDTTLLKDVVHVMGHR
jgi:hypothetical protein